MITISIIRLIKIHLTVNQKLAYRHIAESRYTGTLNAILQICVKCLIVKAYLGTSQYSEFHQSPAVSNCQKADR